MLVVEGETLTVGVTAGDTTIVILFDAILAGVAQATLDVNTQLTTSPFTSEVDEKVGVLLPLFVPFTFHWYDGDVPPFTGVAVKLTIAPAHIVVADAVIDTLGVTAAFTVIVIGEAVAVGTVGQDAEEVITTVITSPLFNVEEE